MFQVRMLSRPSLKSGGVKAEFTGRKSKFKSQKTGLESKPWTRVLHLWYFIQISLLYGNFNVRFDNNRLGYTIYMNMHMAQVQL